jgi:transcriptional antiterminator RfaH
VEKLSRGKRKVSKEVLFPSYLFVEFDQEAVSALSINYTRGVNRIVSFGSAPSQVPDQLISQLKERIEQADESMITELPEKGEKLEVLDGPFRGLNAIFSQIDGDSRAIVLITILSQKVKAVLPLRSLGRTGSVSSRIV